jgi:uncharacterized protein (TIGR03083 family)
MYGDAYRRGHDRVVAFMDGRDHGVIVPACPAWTAADVVRHLTGVSADIVGRVIDGFAGDEWTRAQIDARADVAYDDVVAEWASIIQAASDALDAPPDEALPERIPSALGLVPIAALGPMAISDILQHEFDLRNAYGDTEGRDLMDVHFVAAGHVRQVRGQFAAWNLPTIRIESTDSGMGWDIGYDEPSAVLRASSFEIMRALGGRRTRTEMLAMGWEGDADPFVDALVLPHLAMRETTLAE